jgi:hypothetical protein
VRRPAEPRRVRHRPGLERPPGRRARGYGRGLEQRFEARIRELGAEVVATVMHRNTLERDDEKTIRLALADMKQRTKPDLIV